MILAGRLEGLRSLLVSDFSVEDNPAARTLPAALRHARFIGRKTRLEHCR
jgi:hypothetical protein